MCFQSMNGQGPEQPALTLQSALRGAGVGLKTSLVGLKTSQALQACFLGGCTHQEKAEPRCIPLPGSIQASSTG